MYLIVVGAGPEGIELAKLADRNGHEVALIDKDETRVQAALEKYNVKAFHADVAQGGILEEAEADRADAIVATTGNDSVNLMTMFLGKERGIKTLVSRVNERQHHSLFQRLGVQVLPAPEVIIAQELYHLLGQDS